MREQQGRCGATTLEVIYVRSSLRSWLSVGLDQFKLGLIGVPDVQTLNCYEITRQIDPIRSVVVPEGEREGVVQRRKSKE